MTDELKRDLRLLRLRGAMDTKRFYKKADKGRFPNRFAIGTVIEGPAEFFSGELLLLGEQYSLLRSFLRPHLLTP